LADELAAANVNAEVVEASLRSALDLRSAALAVVSALLAGAVFFLRQL